MRAPFAFDAHRLPVMDWPSAPAPGWRGWLLAGGLSVAVHTGLLWSVVQTASAPRFRVAQQISVSLVKRAEQRVKSAPPPAQAPVPALPPEPAPTTAEARKSPSEPRHAAPRPHQPAPKPAKPQVRASAPRPPAPSNPDEAADRITSAGQPAPPIREADYSADYLNNPLPHYPKAARRRGLQGLVLLEVEVLATGRCGRIGILHSSGHAMLDDAAVEAVKRWRFIPASRAGLPVDHRVHIPIRFRLSRKPGVR